MGREEGGRGGKSEGRRGGGRRDAVHLVKSTSFAVHPPSSCSDGRLAVVSQESNVVQLKRYLSLVPNPGEGGGERERGREESQIVLQYMYKRCMPPTHTHTHLPV